MRTLALVAAAALLAACGGSKELEVQRARLLAERQALEATFDHLEDRLLVNQARVRFWQEMRTRHEGVTAVACTSLEQHALEIARRAAPPAPQLRARQASRSGLREARVAARGVPQSEPSPAIRAARAE